MRSWIWVVALVAACETRETGGEADAPPVVRVDAPPGEVPRFQRCTGRAFDVPAAQGWTSAGSEVTAALGAPGHYAVDEVAVPGVPHVTARFVYGAVRKDLEGEPVAVFVDDCTGWRPVGAHVTDGDGAIDVPVDLSLGPGVYEARFVVEGDASMTAGELWVLPAGTHVIVSDIDGTLTTSDTELFQQILDGSYVPEAYADATTLTAAHVTRGHIVVYLTGRPYWLTNKTDEWLDELVFADGPLHVAPSNTDILPTNESVGEFKKAYLLSLLAKGYAIDLAYGNATTDIYGYTNAGIAADRQWIIGENGGMDGTHAVTGSWTARVAEVEQLATVEQPFRY
jgi:hypothetical protein